MTTETSAGSSPSAASSFLSQIQAQKLHNSISNLVFSHYHRLLPKTGKPMDGKEWTTVASILQCNKHFQTISDYGVSSADFKVISLCTGTKCLGATELSSRGHKLSDSHAEVLARRSFLLYLYDQVSSATKGEPSIFKIINSVTNNSEDDSSHSPAPAQVQGYDSRMTFILHAGITFHLFISQLPCGDACIFVGNETNLKKEARDNETSSDNTTSGMKNSDEQISAQNAQEPAPKKLKSEKSGATGEAETGAGAGRDVDNGSEKTAHWAGTGASAGSDIENGSKRNGPPAGTDAEAIHRSNRTGAKLFVAGSYEEIQIPGKCRIKPGKGDPTLSMSCSDKIAKWQMLGLQGSLMSNFIPAPIRLASITIGCGASFNIEALQRAIFTRFSRSNPLIQGQLPNPESYNCPLMGQSTETGLFGKDDDRNGNPAPASIIWTNDAWTRTNPQFLQVSVNGVKQGVTKKMLGTPAALLNISRQRLFQKFIATAPLCGLNFSQNGTYCDAKGLNIAYNENWSKVKSEVMSGWTDKPMELSEFTSFP